MYTAALPLGHRDAPDTPSNRSLVLSGDGSPVPTEAVRYGLRVSSIVLPAHPLLRTPKALEVVGPPAFGYQGLEYRPVGPYKEVEPVPRAKREKPL